MPFAGTIPATIPRAALMTGGASPLNRAIALGLAEIGFAVAVQCHASTADTEAAVGELKRRGVAVLPADLANTDAVERLVPTATALLGPLGLLVNDTGARRQAADDAVWDAHLEPQLRASFVLMQRFATSLPAGADGVVFNVFAPARPTPPNLSDAVLQDGLLALTRAMALALAPRIRVNCIVPGPSHGTGPGEVAQAVLAMLALPSVTGQMLALNDRQHVHRSAAAGGPAIEERP